MSRDPEIENPQRLSAWIPGLTKKTLIAVKNRLQIKSVGRTITQLALEAGNRLEITDKELAEAEEEMKS